MENVILNINLYDMCHQQGNWKVNNNTLSLSLQLITQTMMLNITINRKQKAINLISLSALWFMVTQLLRTTDYYYYKTIRSQPSLGEKLQNSIC